MQDDLFKAVLPESGINGRVDHRDKVPQRFGRKEAPQIDRHGNPDGKEPVRILALLFLQKGVEQDGI